MSENANAWRLALFTVAIYIAAVTVGLRLLYYLAYVLAGVLVCAFVWAQLSKRGLRVNRQVTPPQTQVGQVIQETIVIHNTVGLPKLWLEVRDQSTLPGHHVGAVVSLKSHGAKRWRVRTRCTHRGLYRLGPTAVLTGDPFGLFQSSRIFDSSAELLVYPPTVPLSAFGLPPTDLPGGSQTELRSYHSTPNAAGIRDYLPGDPVNRIHWPMSARAQKLMVKEFEIDPTADIWLIIDLDESVHISSEQYAAGLNWGDSAKNHQNISDAHQTTAHSPLPSAHSNISIDPTTEEYAVVVTASIAAHLLSQGRSVGMIGWGQHKVAIPADRGGRQLVKILRALAVLRAEGDTDLAEVITAESRQFARQDTLIVVTPSLHDSWLAALQLQLYKGIRASCVLVEPATFTSGISDLGLGVSNSRHIPSNPQSLIPNPSERSEATSALLLVSALSGMDVPTYLVKRDDSIDGALGQQYGGSAVRNLR
jgi:uncharacterized protein (DUF58 family)